MRTNRTRFFERKKKGGIDDSVNLTIIIDHNSFDEFMQRVNEYVRSYDWPHYRIVCVTFRDTGRNTNPHQPNIDLNEETYKRLNATHLVSVVIEKPLEEPVHEPMGSLLETMHKRISRLEHHLRYSSGHGFVI